MSRAGRASLSDQPAPRRRGAVGAFIEASFAPCLVKNFGRAKRPQACRAGAGDTDSHLRVAASADDCLRPSIVDRDRVGHGFSVPVAVAEYRRRDPYDREIPARQ